MKKLSWVVLGLLTAALAASPSDITGRWKLDYAGPKERGIKTVGVIVLDVTSADGVLSGMVKIGSWPGDAPIADGKIDDDRVTFTATGHLSSSTGIPTCQFSGTVNGDEMVLTMTVIRNPFTPPGSAFLFKGKKKGLAADERR
jgi:hypothetical protein